MIPQKLSMSLGEMESEIKSHLGLGENAAVKRSKIKVEVFSLLFPVQISPILKSADVKGATTAHMSVFRKRGKVNNNNTQVTYR